MEPVEIKDYERKRIEAEVKQGDRFFVLMALGILFIVVCLLLEYFA